MGFALWPERRTTRTTRTIQFSRLGFALWPEQKTVLLRRYLAWWEIEGQEKPGLSVFEHGIDGWFGVTTFDPTRDDLDEYMRERVRVGIRKWKED